MNVKNLLNRENQIINIGNETSINKPKQAKHKIMKSPKDIKENDKSDGLTNESCQAMLSNKR